MKNGKVVNSLLSRKLAVVVAAGALTIAIATAASRDRLTRRRLRPMARQKT